MSAHPPIENEDVVRSDPYEVALIQRIRVVPTILRILCDTTGLGFSAIGRVTDTEWVACAVLDRVGFGLGVGGQVDVKTTFCKDVRASKTALVIDKASADPVFCSSLVPRQYGFESYIAVPIILASGSVWGTICGFDQNPARLTGTQILPTLELFAELLAGQIENERSVEASLAALSEERELGRLREQFVAILSHDLRNPVASIASGVSLLERDEPSEKAVKVLGHMRRSCQRMSGLINDTMDFARGRLGGGIPVVRQVATNLGEELRQVVQELQSVHSKCAIRVDFDLQTPVYCDSSRIAQLLSNLLANAVTHGAADQPVLVSARSGDSGFLLSVANAGEQIPPSKMDHLFDPFERAGAGNSVEGLGLGLFIASEIARSHGGFLRATSSPEETVFSFEIPAEPARFRGRTLMVV